MPLAEKVTRGGLDLSGRARPTLAVLPRGNWIRHYYYDFPALLSGGIDQLIEYSLQKLARAMASACRHIAEPCWRRTGLFFPPIREAACRRSTSSPETRRPPDRILRIRRALRQGSEAREPAARGSGVMDRWLGDRLRREPRATREPCG